MDDEKQAFYFHAKGHLNVTDSSIGISLMPFGS